MAAQTQATEQESELETVTLERRDISGEVLGAVDLDPEVFGRSLNIPLMHQVVTAQLAARRSGTQSTKTRAEVRGGGAKPYRQKGTGRARQGTIRAPQFTGGGVALGPKPRSYAQKTPRKMIRQALYCALSDRASEGRICLVDRWAFDVPKTKDALKAIDALGLEGSILVVLGDGDSNAERSFANLPDVDLVEGAQLTAYDVLVSDWIVFTDATLPGTNSESDQPATFATTKDTAVDTADDDDRITDDDYPADLTVVADEAPADADETVATVDDEEAAK